jgi:RNA polymerase sigma-32 factor
MGAVARGKQRSPKDGDVGADEPARASVRPQRDRASDAGEPHEAQGHHAAHDASDAHDAHDSHEASDDDVVAELVNSDEVPAEVIVDEALPSLARPSRKDALARGGTAPLARYDPLQAYMRDVQRYKLLTPEEEKEAATRYFETGDVEAAARLVTANLRLVVKIAYDYRRAHKNLSDLIQEGSIGLMQAVKKYDPYKGVKLSTYAAWWIRAYILRFILNNARLVKVGTTQAQRKLFFNLKKEKAKLAAMGIDATPETIAKRLEVPTEEVVNMDRRLAAGDMPLDAPISAAEGSAQSRIDFLPALVEPADAALADAQVGELLRDKLEAFGSTLKGKDAQIFHQRMLTEEPRTLQELGDEFGVSRERVRQLEKRLQLKLKQFLADELGEGMFEA